MLFPEGKDFTPKVRTRAIEYLRDEGLRIAADRAEKMTHVLPPRHNGVMAAMAQRAGCRRRVRRALRPRGRRYVQGAVERIPFEHPIAARYWRIPAERSTEDDDECIAWLFDWWERIDGWITRTRLDATPSGRLER